MREWLVLLKQHPHLALRQAPPWAWLTLFILISVFLMFQQSSPSSENQEGSSPIRGIDTIIPRGHILIPLLNIENYESLDSLLGSYGLVNLYAEVSPGEGPKRLVAEKVKILRAPKNPSQFGVLVHEKDAGPILDVQSPFTVLILRPDELGTKIVRPQTKKSLPSKRRVLNFSQREDE